jgi:hypothetical protein
MRRQGPDPRGSRFGDRSRLPGASGADRRLRGLREEDRSPGAKGPGWTPPRNRHAGSGSEPSVPGLGARVIRSRARENSRENLLRWRGSPPNPSSGPAIRFEADRRICRSSRRVTGDHRTTPRPPVPYPCRPAEAAAPATYEAALSRATMHSRKAPRARQRRARLSCKISVHKAAKAAQLIPSFLHSGDRDGGDAGFRWYKTRRMSLT